MSKKTDALIEQACERFSEAEEFERDNRELAFEDFEFAAGEQWPTEIQDQRQKEGRPCLTINRLPQFIAQVVGDARQNKPAIKVHPVDEGADPDTAETLEGLIRHIEYASQASTAYLSAFEHAVTGGMGAWRIYTKRDNYDPFVQDACIERIRSPFSVYWDPDARKYDKSDAKWCFVTEWISKKGFEAKYPKKTPDDWEGEYVGKRMTWTEGEKVRIAEYWIKRPKTRNIALMQDGSRVEWEQLDPSLYHSVVQIAEVESHEVVRYLLCGHDVLEDEQIFPGEYIPIVPVYGPEEVVGDRIRYRSLIRYAKDPMRQYNYWQSALTEKIALAPKAPFIATVAQIKGLERFWNNANSENRAYLPYNPDPLAGGPPIRQQPAAINAAELQQAAQAIDDLKATTGIYDASLGNRGNETSGRAIVARQREGDTATFAWIDNLARSIEHTGRILVGIIPSLYDTTRVVRILGEDGSAKTATLNQPAMTEKGPGIVNDLTTGKYDVTISVGPSYATRRLEAADSMMAFMQAVPQAGQVAADLIAKNMDWPGADAIAERLKRMLPPGVIDEELTPQQQQMQMQQQQMQQQAMQLESDNKVADTAQKKAKAMRDMAEAEATATETQMNQTMRDAAMGVLY